MMLHNEIHYAVNRKCAVASQCVGGEWGWLRKIFYE